MESIRLFKSLSITLAAIALIASGCTRNQGGKAPEAAKPATPPAAQEIPGSTVSDANPNDPAANDPTAQTPASTDGKIINYDPSGMTPQQIRAASDALGPVLVGPKADAQDFGGQDLYYSGSGQDSLREIIQAHENTLSADEKAANENLAKRIKSASVDVDWNTRTMSVAVVLERGGRSIEFKTSGKMTNALTMSTAATRGPGDLSFDVTCMDDVGGCKTMLLMVKEDSATTIRTAHVIVRKTDASWYLEANAADRKYNQEFNTLMEIMWLQANGRKIESVSMDTTEVINGTSSFLVKMLARTSAYSTEWMMFQGPLVKPEASSDLNTMIDVASHGPLSRSIRDTRLMYNDGRGNLRLLVTVRKLQEEDHEASLTLTIGRIHTPTRELKLK